MRVRDWLAIIAIALLVWAAIGKLVDYRLQQYYTAPRHSEGTRHE